jgi:hypothetical protein
MEPRVLPSVKIDKKHEKNDGGGEFWKTKCLPLAHNNVCYVSPDTLEKISEAFLLTEFIAPSLKVYIFIQPTSYILHTLHPSKKSSHNASIQVWDNLGRVLDIFIVPI